MEDVNTINIVCVCDDHYLILLAALIKSVEVNHASSEKLVFHIVEDAVSNKSRKKLLNSINKEITSIHYYKMEECIPSSARVPVDKSSYPLNIYMRLFIPYFLPANIKKVIYLDVDMIVQKDISELWNLDLQGNIVAAVKDPWVQIMSRWGGVENYADFKLKEDAAYFNTGLLIMDLVKWRDNDVTTKVIECVAANKQYAHFPDQYGLNVILANQWLMLDPLWNCFAYHEGAKPFLIHFTGRKPIYKSYNFNEQYRDSFYEYLKLTEWNNFKPIGETKRYLKKINNIIGKFNIFS